jgi:hypothetical protein
MKRSLLIIALAVVLGLLLLFALAGLAQMGPGMMGWGGGGYSGQQYCPYCGGYLGSGGGYYGMGPGYGYGYGMGPGMMGPGYQGYGPQYGSPSGPQPQYQQPSKPLAEKDVKAMVENYVQSTRNPNLKVGKIAEKDRYFEAEILTKKNDALVDTILVDKNTGWMRSVY